MITSPIINKIRSEQEAAAVKAANETLSRGNEVIAILRNPVVTAFFEKKALQYYEGFLKDDANLYQWKAKAEILNEFYLSLVTAVRDGQVSAESLGKYTREKANGAINAD